MGELGNRKRAIQIDPEAVIDLVRNGETLEAACDKLGLKYSTFYGWVRRGKWNLRERIKEAKVVYNKKLSAQTAEVFPDKAKPRQLQIFLDKFKLCGEQIAACRFANITYDQLKDFCNPAHVTYNWWFAESFESLLEEQRQELRDKAIVGGLSDARSAAQLLRDIERIQRSPGKDQDGREETISDDQILEALERIAAKVNSEPTELPAVEPGPLQTAPS